LEQILQKWFFTLAGCVADTLNVSSTHAPVAEVVKVGGQLSEVASDDETDERRLVAL
jgi:hypothetical protein